MERLVRNCKPVVVELVQEVELYRQEVEQRIAENALASGNPRIMVKSLAFLSAEFARSTRLIYRDLGMLGERPGGLGAFLSRFEYEMAKLRAFEANSSFVKKRKREPRLFWKEVKIPDNFLAT